ADRGRQPAHAVGAPAAAPRRPVRDAVGARPAHQPAAPAARSPGPGLELADGRRLPREGDAGRGQVAAPADRQDGGVRPAARRGHAAEAGWALAPQRARQARPLQGHGHGGQEAMMRAIRKHAGDFFLIVGLVAAAAGCGAYILAHQRLRFPWESKPLTLKASFATAQAVTPGQGQTVRVSGVRIGDIARVDLKDGRGIVTMDVDPEYAGMIHTDASALLRPKTGLKDMFLELQPGTSRAPVVKDGFTIPIANTLPDINPDEFYGALDRDTRDYLKLLVDGAGQGLKGRGGDLRDLLRRFEPTHRDLARFATAVNERRENLRRLIHNLNVLNGELAGKSTDLTELVDTSSHVFRAFAREQGGITRAVDLLPGALRQTTSTLGKVETFARILGPATRDL